MIDRKQGAQGPVQADPSPIDPIAELDEILAEVLANRQIKFTEADYDALDQERIGYDESVHPYLF